MIQAFLALTLGLALPSLRNKAGFSGISQWDESLDF